MSNSEVVSLIVAGVKNISLILGMFTIETILPGWNLVHKHKTIKFYVVEEQPLQSLSKSTEHTEKSRKIASPQTKAQPKLLKWTGANCAGFRM